MSNFSLTFIVFGLTTKLCVFTSIPVMEYTVLDEKQLSYSSLAFS